MSLNPYAPPESVGDDCVSLEDYLPVAFLVMIVWVSLSSLGVFAWTLTVKEFYGDWMAFLFCALYAVFVAVARRSVLLFLFASSPMVGSGISALLLLFRAFFN